MASATVGEPGDDDGGTESGGRWMAGELPMLHDRLDTFRQLLGSKEESSHELAAQLYGSCVQETRERLGVLINTYVESPEVLASLMSLHEEVSAIDEEYERQLSQGRDVVPMLKESFNSETSTTTTTTATTSTPSATLIPGLDPAPTNGMHPLVAAAMASKESEAEEPLADMTCPICFDDVKGDQCHRITGCSHQYCTDCLDDYLGVRIKEGKVLDMKCPDPRCQGLISYAEVGRIVSDAALFQKYEEFLFLSALRSEPNLRWCPKPGCGNAIIGSDDYPHMVCQACKTEFCFRCQETWHEGTCEQYQVWKRENNEEDASWKSWQSEHSKPCPKCKAPIEKNSGCNHMTCFSCSFQFCWLCGAKYSDNHFSIYNVLGCPGMQYTNGDDMPGKTINSAARLAKRVGMRALIGTGIVLGGALVAALAIPTILIGGPILGVHKWRKHHKRRRARRY